MPEYKPKLKHCYRCDVVLDTASLDRIVEATRTDNHYVDVCAACATLLVAAGTHRRLQPLAKPDAKA